MLTAYPDREMAMNRFVLLGVAILLGSCSPDTSAPSGNGASGDRAAPVAKSPEGGAPWVAMSLLNTTWEFRDDGTPTVVSIDQAGAYIEERGDGTHVDHGTYAQRNGRDCFTSAMGDKGTSCWTAVPQVEIGGTASATADNGSSAVFTRVDYRVLRLPG